MSISFEITHIICSKCGERQPRSLYQYTKVGKYRYLRKVCVICLRKYHKTQYEQRKHDPSYRERQRLYQARYYAKKIRNPRPKRTPEQKKQWQREYYLQHREYLCAKARANYLKKKGTTEWKPKPM